MTLKMVLAALLLAPALALAGMEEAVEAYRTEHYAEAMTQFKALSEQGDVSATYFVGFLYHHGYGVPVDYVEALKWYRKAAAKGDFQSQYYLGKLAEEGKGTERDLVAAHAWYSIAARYSPNPRDAAYARDDARKLERKMTPEQVAKAKEVAVGWKPETN
jgi:TPR repeat protein